ncbi:MAG: tetratricopeptide repeat protein, partial [Anaerolineae bacterium]|nr:tetratricopeptide repeat protein [Anaerolineae bacterium]
MSNSFSQKLQLTCPQTNQPFEYEVWLIIDRDERPDLIEKVKADTLHTVISPYTGDELGGVDAPLLVFQPNHTPPLLFSPAQQTIQEQDQQQATGLIHQLQQNLGVKWQEAWLQNGLTGVERRMLPVALSDDPAEELRKQQEQLEKLKDEEPKAYERLVQIQAAMQRLQQSDDLEGEMEKIKAENPELHQQLIELMRAMQGQQQTGGSSGNLQAILQELSQPPRDTRDMPRRVELSQEALKILPKEGNEGPWASLQNELGNSLVQNPLGNRADNIEQAIAAYQQALTVRTQSAMPVEWAQTMTNLANAYYSRIWGGKVDNIEQAIAAYRQALTVITQPAMPVEWATIMNNLAAVYVDRIQGDRADNIEQAIAIYQQVLKVKTQSNMPVEWAQTMNNLANAYRNRIRGDRADN